MISEKAAKIFQESIDYYHIKDSVIHKNNYQEKLKVLLTQRVDLLNSIDDLFDDISDETKIMKVYRQMKMYNDDSPNPILYSRKKK